MPDDTRLDAYYYVEEKPELGWVPWLKDKPIASGDQELCFHLDRSDVVGSIRLRWDLRPPEGPVTTLRTQDTFTWLPGSGECKSSDAHCCDFAADAGVDAGEGMDAAMPSKPAAAESSSGCAVVVPGRAGRALEWLTGVALTGLWLRARRRLLARAR